MGPVPAARVPGAAARGGEGLDPGRRLRPGRPGALGALARRREVATLVVLPGEPGGRAGKGVTVTTGTEEPVVAILAEEWDAIDTLAQGLGDAEWDLPSECPGWTVRDVLSHLIGIERVLLGDQCPPPLERVAAARRERDRRSQRSVGGGRAARSPGRDVLEEFRDVTARRLADLRDVSRGPLRRDRPEPRRARSRIASSCTSGSWTPGSTSRTSASPRVGPVTTRAPPRSSRWTGCARPCPSSWANRRERPTEPRCASSYAGRCRGASTSWCATGVPRPCAALDGPAHRRPRHGGGGLLAPDVRPGRRTVRPPRRPGGSWTATPSLRSVCSTPWRS